MKTSLKIIFTLLVLLSSLNISQSLTFADDDDDDEYEDRYERQEREEDDDWKEAWYKTRYFEEEDWDKTIQEIVSSPSKEVSQTVSNKESIIPIINTPVSNIKASAPKKIVVPQYQVKNIPVDASKITNTNSLLTPIALFIGANGKEFTIVQKSSNNSFSFIENWKESKEYFSHKAEVIAYLNSLNPAIEKSSFESKYTETNSLSPDYARAVAEAEAQIKALQIKTWERAFILERPLVPTRLNASLKKKEILVQSQKETIIQKKNPSKTTPKKKVPVTQPKVIATPKTPTKVVTQEPVTPPSPVTKPVVKPTPTPVVVTPAPEPTVQLPPPSTNTRAS